MEMNYIRRGSGKPLLLIHGLGGSWHARLHWFERSGHFPQ